MYKVVLYQDASGDSPINALIQELDQKAKTDKNAHIVLEQIMFQIGLLEKLGTRGTGKHIEDDIWELKPGKNRILFFGWENGTYVLLRSFRKKTKKTPKREINKAKTEMVDWLTRHGHR